MGCVSSTVCESTALSEREAEELFTHSVRTTVGVSSAQVCYQPSLAESETNIHGDIKDGGRQNWGASYYTSWKSSVDDCLWWQAYSSILINSPLWPLMMSEKAPLKKIPSVGIIKFFFFNSVGVNAKPTASSLSPSLVWLVLKQSDKAT